MYPAHNPPTTTTHPRSGSVPIYYGADEIKEIFNEDAFIYMDINYPEPALEKIRE